MDIIKNSTFLTLATHNKINPWACLLFYASNETEDNIQLFFVSSTESKHIKNIMINPGVAVTIFDSGQEEGNAQGVQIKGECYIVPRNEYAIVFPYFFKN
jgi:uncharacterized protein YhbP (UPF0306 family)